jgi:hypothetical protein
VKKGYLALFSAGGYAVMAAQIKMGLNIAQTR